MSKELTIKGGYELANVSQIVEMAKVLKGHIVSQKLYTDISGKNYVHVEGWQFCGGLLGLYPRIVEVTDLSKEGEIKWKSIAEVVRTKDDVVVSRGIALCSNKEMKKRSFDEYAVLSMSQTRAIGKAYRNLVGWVMKMAGYESTPAEEMTEKPVDVDNTKMFEELLGKLKKLAPKLSKALAERFLITPMFELTPEQEKQLEVYAKANIVE